MSKLSFRARALDPSKPMPIYLAEELPDLPEYSAINRAVPQMPSGMEKEEESEHHLQRAICTGLIIPTPEVYETTDSEFYERYYTADYKMPKQMIHMQPLNLEQDVPDYDMDSSDETWVSTQGKRLDLDPLKFETMMDRLEKSSGQTVVTLNEAKALLKQDDEISIAVYDYWLNKRLKMQHPLILSVKTESRGNTTPNNPYLAFRRRTEKMQTRKNRKNDESSYEKMLKLRRDLSRAVTLLEMIKRREKMKREQLHLTIEVYEKRYHAQDFNGQMLAEFTSNATKASRPAFAPIYSNQYSAHHASGSVPGVAGVSGLGSYGSGSSSQYHGVSGSNKRDAEAMGGSSRKEKRQYKKRKHKIQKDRSSGSAAAGSSGHGAGHGSAGYSYQYHPAGSAGLAGSAGVTGSGVRDSLGGSVLGSGTADPALSSDEEELANLQGSTASEEEYTYAFRRSKNCQYYKPVAKGDWPWVSKEENGTADPRYRFALTSLRYPRPRCIGFARRRIGRGGRVIIDRVSTDLDDLWTRLDYKIIESETTPAAAVAAEPEEESIVVPLPGSTSNVVTDLDPPVDSKKAVSSTVSGLSVGTSGTGSLSRSAVPCRRQLVIKEETDLDELFMSGVGLIRRTEENSGTVKSGVGSNEGLSTGVEIKEEVSCSDERTSTTVPTSSSTFVSTNISGSVNNSENNVIKSEAGDIVTVKQEVLEDYEHMIDNVNNSYRHRISNNSSSNISSRPENNSFNSSSYFNSRNNFIQSFNNSISGNVEQGGLSQFQQNLSSRSMQQHLSATALCSSGSMQSQSYNGIDENQEAEAGDSSLIAGVYSELLNEIQSSWLHFRPKTPEPLPLDDQDLLLDNDPLFQTDANRIALELQALGDELPADVFNRSEATAVGSLFRTKPFALDSLVEPHPLGLEGSATNRKDADELGIKLETCSNSDNNLSGDSLNDLNLSLNESNEDEKMLDKILQECQIDDMKSLNQTSNFWNGILEDGILNQLEVGDEAGAGAGGENKEDALVAINEFVNPPLVDGLPVNKIGYCSELVGFDKPSNVERFKSKRRKILKRCNFAVGSSYIVVRNPPQEELFKKHSDGELEVTAEAEKTDSATNSSPSMAEVKTEEDAISATVPADQIKIEPPDELLAASTQSAPQLQTNTTVIPTGNANTSFYQSLSAPQIKLEPLNHLSSVPSSLTASPVPQSTSFLITSPSTMQVVQQQQNAVGTSSTVLNPLMATAQTTVPVVHHPTQQQQITITGTPTGGSASSSGTSTPTGSYIVQHTTPIVLSQQQMQQLAAASGGGNIVTVSGNQVLTATAKQALQQHQQSHGTGQPQQIQIQHATLPHQGETYVLTATAAPGQSPMKKAINGPNDKTLKQNVINPKFHTLINQKLAAGQKAGDLNKKQLEMITKALVSSQKMIVKSASPANHGTAQVVQQQQLQHQAGGSIGTSTYNVIHQNSLQQPITILSAAPSHGQGPGQQTTQNKIILTSSPQLIQQAAGQLMAAAAASPHGKIAINPQQFQQVQELGAQGQSSASGTGVAGGQPGQQQHVKLEKTVNMLFDADKNRIVYANIKNSRGQFLAQINPKVVNIIQPIQQQKLMNNVGALQAQQQQQQQTTTSVQNILGGSPTTAIVNSKGIQRIPAVSIRAQQLQAASQQQHQQDGSGTTTVAVATNNATNSIKFIQVTPASVASASAAAMTAAAASSGGANVSNDTGLTTTSVTSMIVPTSSSSASLVSVSAGGISNSGAGSGSTGIQSVSSSAVSVTTANPPTTINITNR
ncbi:uncharacterized protein LOC129760633 [Uranotaenia lowii]|uniref:uncharacterized protein LOC129760633 n=1 Tax=Uranotaenia lowii TaxID=190385 RepID=UPI00247A4B68|nr:uncharacterized protein LOC129760633 [Uranotaenia lowii]